MRLVFSKSSPSTSPRAVQPIITTGIRSFRKTTVPVCHGLRPDSDNFDIGGETSSEIASQAMTSWATLP